MLIPFLLRVEVEHKVFLFSIGISCLWDSTKQCKETLSTFEGEKTSVSQSSLGRKFCPFFFLSFNCVITMLRSKLSAVATLIASYILLPVAYAQDTNLRVVKATFDEAQVSF